MDSNAGEVFVGIDVCKGSLDVATTEGGRVIRLHNDKQGIQGLARQLRQAAPVLIVLEASGGYECLAVAVLRHAGLPALVVNPRQVREFARAAGILAKTDAIDARVLCRFTETMRPKFAAWRTPKNRSSATSRHGASSWWR